MEPPNPLREDDAVLKLTIDGMRSTGDPVVVQYIIHARAPHDDRPDNCLAGISVDFVSYKAPVSSSSPVRPRALGFERIYPGCNEVHHGFVPAVGQLASIFAGHKPESPSKAERVVVRADELKLSSLSPIELRIVGHLLEVEGIGRVRWMDDPAVPWAIEPGLQILRYRRVATFPDFLDALDT